MNFKFLLKTGVALSLVTLPAAATLAGGPQLIRPSADAGVDLIATGKSKSVEMPSAISDVMVGDPTIADVQVRSPRQIWIFGKKPGDTTVSATDASGRVVFQKTIRVSPNVDTIEDLFKVAMPDADVIITPMANGFLLTGTVASAEDITVAQQLAEHYVNKVALNNSIGGEVKVFNRLRTAVPYQVSLQVRIAEVNRTLAKEIGNNLTSRDNNQNGFLFGIGRGTQSDISTLPRGVDYPLVDACSQYGLGSGCGLKLHFNPETRTFFTGNSTQVTFPSKAAGNILNIAGKLFGLDVAAAFDLAERAGLSATLAQPTLTTVSGETASFLAGGQFPFPSSAGLGTTGFQFQSFGVQLTYTPIVLSDGRIRIHVTPSVSDIASGGLRINGVEVPAITQRSADTTVELGSGQSFMIAGLMQNSTGSSVDKYPGLGDVPVLGSLFKSNGWRRNETELVIVITPYLVKPVSDSQIKLPTDGFNAPSDLERVLLNRMTGKENVMNERPGATVAPTPPSGPDFGSVSEAAPQISKPKKEKKPTKTANSAPGFSFD